MTDVTRRGKEGRMNIRKSRSLEEYALAAMAMLQQVQVADTDETTVYLPSAWLREMQRWSNRISAANPRKERKPGGRPPEWVKHREHVADANEGLSLDRGESMNWTQPDHRERLKP